MEEKILLVKLIRNFTIESIDDNPKPSVELILRAGKGIKVKLTPRVHD